MLKSVKNTILDIIRQADLLLLALCTVTSLFGVVMIYSATRYQGGLKCVIIQLCGLALGIVLYFVVSMVDLTEISKKWQWLLAFNLGFFLLLKTPLGVSANGQSGVAGRPGHPHSGAAGGGGEAHLYPAAGPPAGVDEGPGRHEVHPRCGFVGGESAGDHRPLLRDLLRHGQRTGVCVYLRLHGLCRRGSPPVVRSGHLWRRGWLLPTVGAGQDPTPI